MSIRRYIDLVEGLSLQDIPPTVASSVRTWTDKWGKSLDAKTLEWLRTNVPRPSGPKTVYRGISFQIEHVLREAQPFWDEFHAQNPKASAAKHNSMHEVFRAKAVEVLAKKYIGTSDIQIGTPVMINRKKPVSWSTDPKWTYEFAMQGNAYRGVVVQAVVPVEQIVIDFNLLPDDVHRALSKFHYKKEVLTYGPIAGTIVDVGDGEHFHAKTSAADRIFAGQDVAKILKANHRDLQNPEMMQYVRNNQWKKVELAPENLPEPDEDADDPFNRVIFNEEDRVRWWISKMKAGHDVPPIIMGPNGHIVDGNHRAEAARSLGRSIEAYVPL